LGKNARSILSRTLIVGGLLVTGLCCRPFLLTSNASINGAYVRSTPLTLTEDDGTADDSCKPPDAPGVNVCQPSTAKSCDTEGWATIVASGTGASGSVSRMELWANGLRLGEIPGDRIDANLYMEDYTELTIVAVDSNGGLIKSPVYTIQHC